MLEPMKSIQFWDSQKGNDTNHEGDISWIQVIQKGDYFLAV